VFRIVRHAYNVPVRELNMLVIKAILDLPNNDNNYLNNLMLSFEHFLPLIRNYIKNIDSQNDCLYSVEEYCLSQDNRMTPSVFAKVTAHLYLNDVFLEDVIKEWHKNAKPLAEFDFEEQTKLRSEKPVLGLIEWLETAEEEESESEESQ
jgi:translation initiation factor eIF-2B subunit epsilon